MAVRDEQRLAMLAIWRALVELEPSRETELVSEANTCTQDEWWSWPEALAWMASRDFRAIAALRGWRSFFKKSGQAKFLNNGQMQLAREMCGEKLEQIEAKLLLAINQGRVPTKGRPTYTGEYRALEPIAWRGRTISGFSEIIELVTDGNSAEAWHYDIVVNRAALLTMFPSQKLSRPSHQEVVDWCLNWIRSGCGKSENPAWRAFKADPIYKGLARETVFRPAWRDAKTKSA